MEKLFFIALSVFLSCAVISDCSLISQSSIRTCEVGGSSEPSGKNSNSTCKEKMVVAMTLMSGQQNTESLYANIRQVYLEGESQASMLKKPFRIEVSKTETISSYRVHYRGAANGKPTEHSSNYPWRDQCVDAWNSHRQSYPKQRRDDGSFEWDSQGFCCRCGNKRETNYMIRPDAFCRNKDIHTLLWHGYIERENGQLQMYGSSIHYMKMNKIWYDVFDIDMPILQYKVMVSLLEYNGVLGNTEEGETIGNWTLVSSFELSPSKTVSRSPDGRVIARIEGELLGSQGPSDFSTKKLLIPSSRVGNAKTSGAQGWMLVDESLVDTTGKECNKVGTSFTAFRAQPMACQREPGSCFSNQPLDLLKHDAELHKRGKTGKYLLHNYGQVHHSTHPDENSFILRFVHTSLHNSFVVFDIDASDIQFVYNSVKGRIVDVSASDFTALEDSGLIVVEVENTGEIAGDFLVTLAHCHDDRVPSTKKRSMAPGQVTNVSFTFQAFIRKTEKVRCVVELYDVDYNLLGTSHVGLKVNVSCFCYGECGCTCNEDGTIERFDCPEEPPIVIETGSIFTRLFLLILRLVGAHGIVGFFGGILLVLGFVKLLFGGVCCCRKTKAQKHYDEQIAKGVDPKAAKLVKCTGECRGARMAQARYKRKVERVRRMGKDPYRLDDWRNTSYVCNCNDELADIRFVNVIKAVCFFYYCFFLPFIWLGRKIYWGVYRDTAKNKNAAEKSALQSAKKKGKLEELGTIDISAELRNVLGADEKGKKDEQRELTALANKAGTTKPAKLGKSEDKTEGKNDKRKAKKTEKPGAKKVSDNNEETALAAMANVEASDKTVSSGKMSKDAQTNHKEGLALTDMAIDKNGQSSTSRKPPNGNKAKDLALTDMANVGGSGTQSSSSPKPSKGSKGKEGSGAKGDKEKGKKKTDRKKKSKKDAEDSLKATNQLPGRRDARLALGKQHKQRDEFKPSKKAAKQCDWEDMPLWDEDYESRKKRDGKERPERKTRSESRRSERKNRDKAGRGSGGKSSRAKGPVRASPRPRSRGRTPEHKHPHDTAAEKNGEHSSKSLDSTESKHDTLADKVASDVPEVLSSHHSDSLLKVTSQLEKALSPQSSKQSHSSSKDSQISFATKRDSHESKTSTHGSDHSKSSHDKPSIHSLIQASHSTHSSASDSKPSIHSSFSKASHTDGDNSKHSAHSVLSAHSAPTSIHSSHDSKSSTHSSVQKSGSGSEHTLHTRQHSTSTHSSVGHISSEPSKSSTSTSTSSSCQHTSQDSTHSSVGHTSSEASKSSGSSSSQTTSHQHSITGVAPTSSEASKSSTSTSTSSSSQHTSRHSITSAAPTSSEASKSSTSTSSSSQHTSTSQHSTHSSVGHTSSEASKSSEDAHSKSSTSSGTHVTSSQSDKSTSTSTSRSTVTHPSTKSHSHSSLSTGHTSSHSEHTHSSSSHEDTHHTSSSDEESNAHETSDEESENSLHTSSAHSSPSSSDEEESSHSEDTSDSESSESEDETDSPSESSESSSESHSDSDHMHSSSDSSHTHSSSHSASSHHSSSHTPTDSSYSLTASSIHSRHA